MRRSDEASAVIATLVADLEAAGVAVDLFAFHMEDWVAGRVHYPGDPSSDGPRERPLVELNEPTAYLAMLTLAHEVGHLVSFYACNGKLPVAADAREDLAAAYGWPVLAFYAPWVTRRAWCWFHETTAADYV